MVKTNRLLDLQFDQYSRQHIVKQLVKAASKKKKLNILDIGGHLGMTVDFFDEDDVTITDLYDVDNMKNYVKASALDLPFSDNKFDAVVSFDVFEHIPEQDRMQFLEEAFRVSNDMVVIAAPFHTPLTEKTEKEADETYKKIFGKQHPWLIEHIDNGLPNLEITELFFKQKNAAYSLYASNNIFLWKIMMNFYFACGDSRLTSLSQKVNRFYNSNIHLLGDHSEPSYRKILFARKNTADLKSLPKFESVFDDSKYSEFLELILSSYVSIIQDKSTSVFQAGMLVQNSQEQEIFQLKQELSTIKRSKAWRLTNKLNGFKSKPRPRKG